MVFNSLDYVLFFPIVTGIHYLLPPKYRWIAILLFSYVFYSYLSWLYTGLLVLITLLTYTFTRLIDGSEKEKVKSRLTTLGVTLSLTPLLLYKYSHFFIATICTSTGLAVPELPDSGFIIPLGLSFYTFMAIGYLLDVNNEEVEVEKNPFKVALFLSFFPILLSGPIERASNMFPQFNKKLMFDQRLFVLGLKLILWGYFMKLVLADRLDLYINAVFNNVEHHSGITLLIASLLYPLQVYGDFGGYSLIAIGSANVLGIEVMMNFNRPFFSTSFAEFFRRWHMSLITWLTDYVYTPISFSLRSFKKLGIVMALTSIFILSGIWHGATFNYILWGAYLGGIVSIDALFSNKRNKLESKFNLQSKWWYLLLTMSLTYVLFTLSIIIGPGTESLEGSYLILRKICSGSGSLFMSDATLVYASIAIIMVLLSEFRDEFFPSKFLLFNNPYRIIRWTAYVSVLVLILTLGVLDGGQFIYFKF